MPARAEAWQAGNSIASQFSNVAIAIFIDASFTRAHEITMDPWKKNGKCHLQLDARRRMRGHDASAKNTAVGVAVGGVTGLALSNAVGTIGGAAVGGLVGSQIKKGD